MRYAAAFVGMLLTDYLWGRYTFCVAQRRAIPAARYSVGIMLAGALVTILYVADHWTLPAACAGAFVGTVLAVRRG